MESNAKRAKMANTYRMTDRDIRLLIQLRATNDAIFTGRKNSALRGWRAISKEMGLQGIVSARQLKKKWDNLKEKYKLLKNPPIGMEKVTKAGTWRWFHLMDEAISGRLAGTASILQPSLMDDGEDHSAALSIMGETFSGTFEMGSLEEVETLGGVLELSDIKTSSKAESPAAGGNCMDVRNSESRPMISQSQTAVLYTSLLPDVTATAAAKTTTSQTTSSTRDLAREAAKVDRKLAELQRERRVLESEQAAFDKELIALERERQLLNRDLATLERDRTAVERDRAAVERDRALLDRDRAIVERDRAFLERDRAFLEKGRQDLERERELSRIARDKAAEEGDQADVRTEKEVALQTRFYQSLRASDLEPGQLDSRQRLLSLFQKLVEKL